MSGAERPAPRGLAGRRAAAHAALAAMAALILLATLRPSRDLTVYELPPFCILCGERGAADALANVVLFMPLGLLLVLSGGRVPVRLAAAGAAFSLVIEAAQLAIPGRDPSVGDLLFNTLGTALGVGLMLGIRRWALPAERARRALLVGATAAAAAAVLATGALFEPAGTRVLYYGQWTPERKNLERYEGRLVEAAVGGLAVADGPIEQTPAVRKRLLRGEPVSVVAIAGPPVAGLAPLFSIMDAERQEILLIGPDRDDDLVVRYRMRSAGLLLDRPVLRLPGALSGVSAGDTLRVSVWREPAGRCIVVNGTAHCGSGFTAGRGWALIMFPDRLPAWAQRLLDLAWVAAVAAPAGFWAARRGEAAAAAAVMLAALLLAPAGTELLPTPPAELLAGLAGVGAGAVAGRILRARLHGAPTHWPGAPVR